MIDRVRADVEKLQSENPGKPVPIDLVTTSGSGLDPHISPAAAEFQVPRVARERGMSEDELRQIVARSSELVTFEPKHLESWQAAYERFSNLT